eukprot:scaffold60431_cov35-Tisochrysis_lutea.AAC.3
MDRTGKQLLEPNVGQPREPTKIKMCEHPGWALLASAAVCATAIAAAAQRGASLVVIGLPLCTCLCLPRGEHPHELDPTIGYATACA